MKKSSRIKLLILCLILSIVSFAFACDGLGGSTGGGSTGGTTSDIVIDDYINHGRIPTYNTYGEVKVDGILDDEVWENQRKVNRELVVGGANYAIEMSAYLAENGVVMYIQVETDGGVYVNPLRGDHNNTGMEVYISSGDKTAPQMNSWEIPLQASGKYNTSLYTYNNSYSTAKAYVDVKTQIDGADDIVLPGDSVNLSAEESAGYTLEFYIPYAKLNESSKPSSIAMTAAVLHMASYTSDTRNWVDVHAACDGVSGFSNIQNRYFFNEQGYLDTTVITPRTYTVNGVEGSDGIVENGHLELDIPNVVGKTGSITAIPNAGYMFDYLIVNGVKQSIPYYEVKKYTGDLDIQVGFKSLDGVDVVESATVNVTAPKAAPLGYTLEGKSIRLFSSLGIFEAEIIDGAVSFENVPVGTYTLSVNGLTGLDTPIVLEKDVSEYAVDLEYTLFSGSAAKYDEASQSYTINIAGNKLNSISNIYFDDNAGTMVWAEMTVGFDKEASGVTDGDDILLTSISGVAKGSSMDIGLWWLGKLCSGTNKGSEGNELRLRTAGNAAWASINLSSLRTDSSEETLHTRVLNGEKIQIAVGLVDNVATIFYKMEGDAEWYIWRTLNEYEQIRGYAVRSVNDTISNIKVANTDSMFDAGLTSVSVSVNDDTMGTVVAKGSIYGGDIKVLPQPAEGYIVYDIKVNGVSYPFAAAMFNAKGGEIVVNGSKSFVNEVYVQFGPAVEATEYTFTLCDTNGNLINGEVAFVAEGHYSPVANVVDGVVTVALEAGVDYVITMTGYTSATVSVSAEGEVAETTFILTKGILYTNGSNYQYGINTEDGDWWTTTVKDNVTPLFIDATDWAEGKAVAFHFDALLNTRQFPGIRFYDENSYVSFQFAVWDGFMDLKISSPSLYVVKNLVPRGSERASFDVKIYVEGSTLVFTVNGEFFTSLDLHDIKEEIVAVDRVGFFMELDTVADFKVTNIAVSEEKYDYVDVMVKDASSDEFTAVTAVDTVLDQFTLNVSSLQVLAGNTVTLKVLPGTTADFESYFVKSITVDGIKQSFEAGASGEIVLEYAIPAGATSIEVVVETAVQQAVEGTMKVYLASFEGNEIVTDLSKVLFNGANLADATIDADGTISFTMNTGVYAIEYADGGYEVASLALDEVSEEIVIYLNKVIFEGSSVWSVSYDYNDEDGVSVSKYTKDRTDLVLAETTDLVGVSFKYELEGDSNTKSYPYIFVTDEAGISYGYQFCVWTGNLYIKPAITNATTGGVENRTIKTVGSCKTGKFSADVKLFAVGTKLYFIFTNVISNGQPAADVVIAEDFSANGTVANVIAGGGAEVFDRYEGGKLNNIRISHNNDGVANEASFWAFSNIEIMKALPAASVVTTDSDDATVVASADSVDFGSSVTITVTPASDVLVKAVIVNGVEYAVAAEIGAPVEYTLSNNSLIDLYEVSAVVASDFASGTITIANGKTIGATGVEDITFDLSSKAFALLAGGSVIVEGTLVDGALTFADIPFGTYTVSIDNGNFVGEIVIGEADINATVVVNAVLFSGSEDAMTAPHSKISLDTLYTGDAIVYGKSTDKNIGLYFNEGAIGGKVVWAEQVVTLNAVNEETWLQGFGFRPFKIDNGNYKQLTAGVRFVQSGHGENASGSNEFQARMNDVSWSKALLAGTENKSSITVKIVSWVENGTANLKIYDYATGTVLATLSNNKIAYEYISHIENKNNRNLVGEVVHSLKIATEIPGAAISAVDGDNYTISTDKAVVKSGETVTITVTPDADNVLVGSIFVNGVAINPTLDNGVFTATWTNNDKGLSEAIITAVSTTAVAQEYTATLGWKFANDPLYYGIADGKVVKFVGQYMTKEAVIADGAVTVELVAGEYEVILPDGTKTTFVATEDVADAATEINAIRSLTVADSLDKTVNADGTINVTGTKAGLVTIGNGTNLAGTVVGFDYSIDDVHKKWAGAGVRIRTANDKTTDFNLLNGTNTSLRIKNQTTNSDFAGSYVAISGAVVDAVSFIKISEDGKSITISMTTQGKTSQATFTADSVITSLEMGNLWAGGHTWAMDNIEVTDMLAVAGISYLPNDNLASVAGPASVNFGETASIVVKANEGYAIKSASANGVALPIVNNEDGTSTISLAYNEKFSTNITIDIETVALSYQALTINVSGVNYDGSAASIESVTLYDEDGVAYDVELVSGVGTIELLAGTYTLEDIEGYFVTEGETSVVVAGEPVSMAVVVRESMFVEQGEGWVESYAEETGYSYTKSTQARSDLLLAQDIEGLVGMSFKYELEGGSNTKTYPYIYLVDDAGVSVGYQLCVWKGSVILKPSVHNGTINGVENRSIKTVGSCKEGKFSADIKLFASGTNVVIAFTNVISNGQPAADFVYYEDFSVNGKLANVNAGSGVLVAERFNGTVKGLRIAHNNDGVANEATNWALVNVQPITAVPAEDISYVENEGLGYVVAPTSVQHGSSAIVTVKLFAGYKLGNVEISNATYTQTRNDDGSISFEIKPATIGAAIEVNITALVSDVKYAVNYTVKNDGITNPLDWADTVAEGLEVEVYDGDLLYTTATTGADGALALELENGTYTVEVAGYFAFTAVVDGADVASEQVVSYKMFSNNDSVSQAIANGTTIKTDADPNFSADVVYAEMVIYHDAFLGEDKGLAGFKSAYVGTESYSNFEIQKTNKDFLQARPCNVDGVFTPSKAASNDYLKSVYSTTGYTVAMAIIDGTPIFYAQNSEGKLVPAVYDSIRGLEATKVLGLHVCTTGTIVSIKTYTTLDNEYVQSVISPADGNVATDFSVNTDNAHSDVLYFDASEDNVIEFDFTWTSKSSDRFFPWVLLNGYTPIQLCVWNGAVYLKPNGSNTGSATLATRNDGIQSATVRIKADADGRMGFYKVVNGVETFLTNFTAYGGYCKNIYMEDIYSIQFCVEGIDSFADTSSNAILNGNPFAITNIQVFDSSVPAEINYEENAELYTFTVAPATVAYGSTETIVITPVENAVITAVKANGISLPVVLNEDGTYTATLKHSAFVNTYDITVEGEIVETLSNVTLSVSGLIYGANGIESANMVGKTVTVKGTVEKSGVIAEDGSVVIADLPYGDYTASIANYTVTSGAIVVDAEEVSANVTATYNLLSGGTVANQDMSKLYTDGSISYVKEGGTQSINTAELGKIIYAEMLVEHDITVEGKTSNNTTGAVFGYTAQSGNGYTGVNVGYNSNGFTWRLRVHNSTSGASEWAEPTIAGYDNVDPLKVIIAQAHVGTQVYAYVLDADTREVLSSYKLARLSNDTGISKLCCWFGDGTTVLSGIKLSTTLPESIINLVEGETYEISSNKTSVALESTANVTITAKEGYKISDVKVTGATFSLAINDAGATVVTVKANTIGKEISISVETEELTTLYNVALTLKNDGETNPLDWGTYVPENANANIYLGDLLVKTVKVGANGLIEEELEAGSYTFVVDNYFSSSFEVVDADVAEECVLVYKTLADSTGINEALSAGNSYVYPKGNPGFTNTNIVYAETKFKTTAYGAAEDAGLFGYQLKSNGEYIDTEIQNQKSGIEQVRSCSGTRLTWAASKAPIPAGIDDALIQGEGVTIAMAIIDNTPVFYVENLDGNLVPVYAFPQLRNVTSIFGYHVCRADTTFIDIKTYTTLDNEYVQSRLNGLTDEVVLSGDGISGNNEDGYTYHPTAKNKSTNFTFFNTGAVSEIHYTMEWDNASTAKFFPNLILNGEEIQMCIWNGSFTWKWARAKGVGSGGVKTGKVDIVIKNDANNHLVIYRIENGQEVLWYDIGALHASTTDNAKKYGTFSMNAIGSFAFSSGGWDATSGPFDGSPFKITNLKFI